MMICRVTSFWDLHLSPPACHALVPALDNLTQVASTDQSCVFSPGYRASGVLLHLTSLPSPHGIGDFGPAAYRWIDALASAGQNWWQILPIGPPGSGNSPYTPLSTFACNPLLISPEGLIEEGLLEPSDFSAQRFPEEHVDFGAVIPLKNDLLDRAWQRFCSGEHPALRSSLWAFCKAQSRWLDDFALFMVLKARFGGVAYTDWPAPFLMRDPEALQQASRELAGAIERVKWEQFICFRQLGRLRQHAARRGVKLFGDLPIFVSADSADVWANPSLFLLDQQRRPEFVAGVPPDYFSATGQLWGNPVYDWQALKRTGYAWWIDRLRSLLGHHDVVRLDHFRGFSAAWHVPAGSPTAENGQWVPGPGADFFAELRQQLGGLPFVAEDLGTITDDVRELLADFRFPRMGVLQFAFDGDLTNAFLPRNLVENMIAYTGTHDNDTTRGWYRTLPEEHRTFLWEYLDSEPRNESAVAWTLIDLAWSSRSAVAIAPLQDVLNLGSEARMNLPGVAENNWAWRCTEQQMSQIAWEELQALTHRADRLVHQLA